jgi:glycosyltransferase involved in cell wall biosynthesis
MSSPRFSVIIPALNEEKFLPKLLTSLTRQTVKNFDVIVVDGHSVDKTVAVANQFKNKLPQLTIIECEKAGVSRQRNIGAATGKADWLVFVDADSVLLSNFIGRVTRYIDRSHAKFFTTWLKADRDDPMHAIAAFGMNSGVEAGILVGQPWAPGPLTVVRRDVFEMVGGYNEGVTYGEDHELGVVIDKRGVPFKILREVLYIYSFRRFRKEKTLEIFNRTLLSTLSVVFTSKGLKRMPGFVSGGLMYNKKKTKAKNKKALTEFEKGIKKIVEEFIR